MPVGVEQRDMVRPKALQRAFQFRPQVFGRLSMRRAGFFGEGGLGGDQRRRWRLVASQVPITVSLMPLP